MQDGRMLSKHHKAGFVEPNRLTGLEGETAIGDAYVKQFLTHTHTRAQVRNLNCKRPSTSR